MKFKERRGNVFVFDGGYDSEELTLEKVDYLPCDYFMFDCILIWPNLEISTDGNNVDYKDIQTAVNLMNILKDEGLV